MVVRAEFSCFCGHIRTFAAIGLLAWLDGIDRIGAAAYREQLYYNHVLIVRWVSGVGKGQVSAGQGLFVVTLSGAEGFADGIEILSAAKNDRCRQTELADN